MVHTRWTEPNRAHEEAVSAFIERILPPQEKSEFLCRVARFAQRISYAGMTNGIGQAVLKIASPGVPDFYQGCELWDRHLVDPDNRSPVDFQVRVDALKGMVDCEEKGKQGGIAGELLSRWPDGHIKLYAIWKSLRCRRQHPELFREGEFLPLEAAGEQSHHLMAFVRRRAEEIAIVVIPKWVANIPMDGDKIAHQEFWKGTNLRIPTDSPASWRNIFTCKNLTAKSDTEGQFLAPGELLEDFPVALLIPSKNAA
jgi:(1->4)-alpha-D-glucan 1-alpha-D-glucosylmutase